MQVRCREMGKGVIVWLVDGETVGADVVIGGFGTGSPHSADGQRSGYVIEIYRDRDIVIEFILRRRWRGCEIRNIPDEGLIFGVG